MHEVHDEEEEKVESHEEGSVLSNELVESEHERWKRSMNVLWEFKRKKIV